MLQPRKYDLLARLLDLAREEDLVQDRIHLSPTSALPSSNLFFIYSYLIEIEHQIQLTNIPKYANSLSLASTHAQKKSPA